MKLYIPMLTVYFLPIHSMQEQKIVPENKGCSISYKKMVTTFGYPATSYLINAWTRKKSALTAIHDDREKIVELTSHSCLSRYNILCELEPTIVNNITKNDDDYLLRLREASYTPRGFPSPCLIKAFTGEFDSENNPIIITTMIGNLVLFNIARQRWRLLNDNIDILISCTSPVAHNKKNFLYGTYEGNVYLRGPNIGSINFSAYGQTITAVALAHNHLAWGNERGCIRVHTIQRYRNAAPILSTVHPDLTSTTALALSHHYVFAGHSDGIVKIWDYRNPLAIQSITTQEKNSYGVTSLLSGEPYIRIGYGNGDVLTYDRCMPSSFIHKAKGVLHDHKPIVAMTQNKEDDTIYTATNTKIIKWRPGFECEEAYSQLTTAERLWLHYAFQDSLPEHLQQ